MLFCETFLSAVHINESISNVEKFTYLKGYLQSKVAGVFKSFSLTSHNYTQALKSLKEQCRNEQLIITTHMKKQ